MNIDLGGNTLINAYFTGMATSPNTDGNWLFVAGTDITVVSNKVQTDTSEKAYIITLPVATPLDNVAHIQRAKLYSKTSNLITARNDLLNLTITDYDLVYRKILLPGGRMDCPLLCYSILE